MKKSIFPRQEQSSIPSSFFKRQESLLRHIRFKIAVETGLSPKEATDVLFLRSGPYWNNSRERRLVLAIVCHRIYSSFPIPTVKDLCRAELLCQKKGITIEDADKYIWAKYKQRI